MKTPDTYARRILLCVTGLSPQIVTETLYALASAESPFVPTEIHLLTTLEGAKLARAALLHPDGGQYHALLADYPQLGKPRFNDDTIHIIADHQGNPLTDIRSPQDNAAAADAITACLAELTRDDNAALHVSIAGGRKTMGFYLGYAFSLYARQQDRLSHVLVSAPFESHPDFFFPPAKPRRLTTRDNRHVDTAEAQVTLAEIPVVLLRHGLPEALRDGRATYVETVSALSESFAPPRLEIDLGNRSVRCGDRPVRLSPALLAWLTYWAQCARTNAPMRHWREVDAQDYLRRYERVVGSHTEAFERTQTRLREGMEKSFFGENNSKLERELKKALGPAATPYLLARDGRRPNTRRGLTLPPEAIFIQGD
jgi:CRISPR-associated protein (TIGR02584 family)